MKSSRERHSSSQKEHREKSQWGLKQKATQKEAENLNKLKNEECADQQPRAMVRVTCLELMNF